VGGLIVSVSGFVSMVANVPLTTFWFARVAFSIKAMGVEHDHDE